MLLVAVSLGADNFAASVAIGLAGVDARIRFRVAVAFGLFEGGMPLLGLVLGRSLAGTLGSHARWVGGGLLIATGVYELWGAVFGDGIETEVHAPRQRSSARLVMVAAALSIDNLIVGFALGAYRVSLVLAAVTIAVISVLMSLIGLELGVRIGERLARGGELLGGVALIGVGATIATGVL